jgi:hypothetical protein
MLNVVVGEFYREGRYEPAVELLFDLFKLG